MPAFLWGWSFLAGHFGSHSLAGRSELEVLQVEKGRVKTEHGWGSAACVLTMICVNVLLGTALAQSDSVNATSVSPSQKTDGAETAGPKKHGKIAATDSTTKNSRENLATSRQPHAASHPVASKHPKSSAAVGAHHGKAVQASSRTNISKTNARKKNSKKKTTRGQQKIDPERAQAIQEALIREHYMSGEPARTWNQASEDAMRRYQADHGWQAKEVPDSRALIRLGLGPSHDHLLNPESAMTTGPDISQAAAVTSASPRPVSHSAAPETRMNPEPVSADPGPVASPDHDGPSPQ